MKKPKPAANDGDDDFDEVARIIDEIVGLWHGGERADAVLTYRFFTDDLTESEIVDADARLALAIGDRAVLAMHLVLMIDAVRLARGVDLDSLSPDAKTVHVARLADMEVAMSEPHILAAAADLGICLDTKVQA